MQTSFSIPVNCSKKPGNIRYNSILAGDSLASIVDLSKAELDGKMGRKMSQL